MKPSRIPFLLVAILVWPGLSNAFGQPYTPADGDIFFQSLARSPLGAVIEGSTHSSYSHCGVLYNVNGRWFIYEAIGPVKATRLKHWIQQGKGGRCDVFRLKEKYREKIPHFIAAIKTYMGRPYDILYDFDDEKIYCSELIFKAFRTVYGEDLGEIVTLGELDWKPYEEFIRDIDPTLPLERKMITPKHLSAAQQLEPVYQSIPVEAGNALENKRVP